MKILLIFTIILLFSVACKDQVNEVQTTDVQFTDLAKYNMKIIPATPTTNDKISLVIYDDCNYNNLSGIRHNGNTIDIDKQFNSMMKWPCSLRNDTILIGKLSQGTYLVNYKLLDIASPSAPSVTFSFSFNLLVNK